MTAYDLCGLAALREIRTKCLTQRRKGAKVTENEIARVIVDAAYRVHTSLGPGLLESVYEVVLAHELEKRGMRVERPAPVRINYDGVSFDEAIGFPRLVMVISSFP